jgi:hypothetical protein
LEWGRIVSLPTTSSIFLFVPLFKVVDRSFSSLVSFSSSSPTLSHLLLLQREVTQEETETEEVTTFSHSQSF